MKLFKPIIQRMNGGGQAPDMQGVSMPSPIIKLAPKRAIMRSMVFQTLFFSNLSFIVKALSSL